MAPEIMVEASAAASSPRRVMVSIESPPVGGPARLADLVYRHCHR
jgi:hypothetical protein